MEFIKKKWLLILLLSITLTITLYGIFHKNTTIAVIGALLSFSISLYRAYSSFKSFQKLKRLIDSSDNSLGIKRDLEGNVTETALNWEEL